MTHAGRVQRGAVRRGKDAYRNKLGVRVQDCAGQSEKSDFDLGM